MITAVSIQRWRRNKEGAVLVEIALALLLLFTILFGTIEFGWAFFTKAVVTNAAREGARYAVTPPADPSTVTERVANYLQNFSLDPTQATIYVDNPLPPKYEPVTVRVTYTYAPLTGSLILNDNFNIVAEARMMRE